MVAGVFTTTPPIPTLDCILGQQRFQLHLQARISSVGGFSRGELRTELWWPVVLMVCFHDALEELLSSLARVLDRSVPVMYLRSGLCLNHIA